MADLIEEAINNFDKDMFKEDRLLDARLKTLYLIANELFLIRQLLEVSIYGQQPAQEQPADDE